MVERVVEREDAVNEDLCCRTIYCKKNASKLGRPQVIGECSVQLIDNMLKGLLTADGMSEAGFG